MRKNKNNYQTAVKTAVIFVLISSFIFILMISPHGIIPIHQCAGDACRICLDARFISGLTRSAAGAIIIFYTIFAVCIGKNIIKKIKRFLIKISPVSLMNVIIS